MKEKTLNNGKYICVGTSLYKIVQRPLISGDYIEEKISWSYETLRQDFGRITSYNVCYTKLLRVDFEKGYTYVGHEIPLSDLSKIELKPRTNS